MKLKNSRWTIVMLGVVCCCLLALSAAIGISSANSMLLWVKPTATGSGNCSDWDNACDLQKALKVASEAGGGEIWVAEGTHKPANPMDRTATFQLANGVALYGGFAGTESSRDQRDWTLHETILSGDIGTEGVSTDNSYHVVTGSGTDATAILDGFTITGGNADGSEPDDDGGGMYNDGGSPTLTNVTFSGNSADGNGGGIYNWDANPTLTDVTFSSNSALGGSGGGMSNHFDSSPALTNVTLSGNSAGSVGGGMANDISSPTLINATFSGNSAASGGGMYNYNSSLTMTNCILWGNTATSAGAQIYNNNSAPTISYSLVQDCGGSGPGWDTDLGTDGGGNIDADPQFVDADGPDDTPGTLDDNLRLQLTSPAIDAGDNTAVPAGVTADLDGRPRFVDIPDMPDSGVGPAPIVDMGAYEAQLKVYLPLVMRNYAP